MKIQNICNNLLRKLPILLMLIAIFYLLGIYIAFFASPEDYLQGKFVRIMYIHVPSAILGLLIYGLMGFLNFIYIVWNIRNANILSFALAKIGMSFTIICLITGSLWGKPIWNVWWVWDSRLTSMFILLVFYISYVLVWDFNEKNSKLAAILNLIGIINLPVVKFSVNFWNSLHQTSSFFRKGGLAIDKEMLLPLGIFFITSILLTITIWIIQIKTLLNKKKINRLILMYK